MTFTAREVIDAVTALLEGEAGLAESLESLKDAYIDDQRQPAEVGVHFLKTPPEHQDKAWRARYPVVHVYCDKIESRPTERLRRFSGRARVVAEVRVTQDRLDWITRNLHYYVDAVRDVVERKAGCLADGLYLSPEYEVQVEAVKKGGLNWLQTARINCAVIVNRA